ncbi:hypothetical protein K1T71_010115 [Dendrolimus kikuchii]|uniref:Uncharacterized protein n=1 Tax=Dendrolimus kikuchii TaxID=765133 RepID=A0ACC1CQP7_9NEOP|nr:hypothetical protein K1T71_010115 [Dendrolimus kikuchii]
MADLPADRVSPQPVFSQVSTDFAGPFLIKSSTLRNAKLLKGYFCVFVCASIEYEVSSNPLNLEIKCQTNRTTTFQIKPSSQRRLVIALEESQRTFEYVPYTIIEPNDQFGKLETSPRRLYTIWAATLDIDSGPPLIWEKGPQIHPYNASLTPEHRDYNVSVFLPSIVLKEDKFVAVSTFTWNNTTTDMCYQIAYICDEFGIVKEKKMWPTKVPVLILELPTDNTCTIRVIGQYGATEFIYKTPSCANSEECKKNNKKPWAPENIYVQASEDGLDSWIVRVNWTQPILPPDHYNVTLRANEIQSVLLDGNITEAIFKGVSGQGLYNVSISSIIQDWPEHTSRRALFPAGGANAVWAWWWGAGGAWALALVAAIAACLTCRRRAHPNKDFFYPMSKKIKEFDIEALGSENAGANDHWEVRAEKLTVHEVVGEGAFGVVRRGTLKPQFKEVAIKMLKDFPTLDEIRSFRAEMELMKSVGAHPHIVSLLGCASGRRPLIVTEYCSRGDLLSYLRCSWDAMVYRRNAKYYNNNIGNYDYRKDSFKTKMQKEHSRLVVNKLYDLQGICDVELTIQDLLSFCRQIAMGMEFLASNKVVHRDLAARNILITGDRTLKIADFGLSRDVYEENQYKQKGNGKLPVKWMALESLTRKIYTTQSDVWSFGIVIWEVVTVGGSPYPQVPVSRLVRLLTAGYRMPQPVNCSKELYELMSSCWRAHPRDRPTFSELHQRLDDLLNDACAHEYLSLEPDGDDAPPTPKSLRYLRIFTRGKRHFTRGESYERPLNPAQCNHYSVPPVVPSKEPVHYSN